MADGQPRDGLHPRGRGRDARRPGRRSRPASRRSNGALHAPLIAEINRLKREKNAVILAHNYMTPEIFHGVGDFVGDSLGLAREAARTDARIIVQAGVHFMAETSKVLCPEKTVLIPDLRAGCSLAASITAADVRLIKQRYPGVPVVTYVNTTADVKAETDICCTSANAVQVVEAAAARSRDRPRDPAAGRVPGPQRRAPDRRSASSPGRAAARCTSASTPTTSGRCASAWPDAEILAHPECPAEVLELADFAGSTTAMTDYVVKRQPRQVVLITECSMADNIAAEAPDTEFVRPCNLCPHMKRISLENIYEALLNEQLRGDRRRRRSPSARASRCSG